MKTTSNKIKKLSEQKAKLEAELKTLMKERNNYVVNCLDALPSENIPTEIIIGGLMQVVETYNSAASSSDTEAWQKAGEKFCKRIAKSTKESTAKKVSSPTKKQQKAA